MAAISMHNAIHQAPALEEETETVKRYERDQVTNSAVCLRPLVVLLEPEPQDARAALYGASNWEYEYGAISLPRMRF